MPFILGVHLTTQRSRAADELFGRSAQRADPIVYAQILEALMAMGSAGVIHVSAEDMVWSAVQARDELVRKLRAAVDSGRVVPLLTHGAGAFGPFLSLEEVAEELRNNRLLLEETLGPLPARLGLYPPGLAYDPRLAEAYESAGVVWRFSPYRAARVESMHGEVPVRTAWVEPFGWNFDPSAYESALRTTLQHTGAPQGVTLEVAPGTTQWEELLGILGAAPAAFEAVPDTAAVTGTGMPAAYYPLFRPLVRADGVYHPIGFDIEGPDAYQPNALSERRPYVLWEAGVPLLRLLDQLFEGLQLRKTDGGDAAEPVFLLRRLKQAWRWGPVVTVEAQHETAQLLMMLASAFRLSVNEGGPVRARTPMRNGGLAAMRAFLGFQIDNRLNAIEYALRNEGRADSEATVLMREAREHRVRAAESLARLEEAIGALMVTPGAWFRMVDMLDMYARELLAATTPIERLADRLDPSGMRLVHDSYRAIYPPQVPVILDRLGSDEGRASQISEPAAGAEAR